MTVTKEMVQAFLDFIKEDTWAYCGEEEKQYYHIDGLVNVGAALEAAFAAMPEPARKLDPEWRYEIQYGPEGEANYAWLYRGNEMVATMKTHHAVAIASALAAAEERGRSEERELCNQVVCAAWGQNVTIEVLSAATAKEPTP